MFPPEFFTVDGSRIKRINTALETETETETETAEKACAGGAVVLSDLMIFSELLILMAVASVM